MQASSQLTGSAVSPGVATGTARIVLTPQDVGYLGSDYVLICPSTDPGWTPLFLHARGLVVERGGILSHGAIVARDFGIPAVVCPDATRLIPEGKKIRIDGNTGRIVVTED
jgi:pyruvate,water dikinase